MGVAAKIRDVMRRVGYMQSDRQLESGARYKYLSEDKLTGRIHDACEEVGLVIVPLSVALIDQRAVGEKGMVYWLLDCRFRVIDAEDDSSSLDLQVLGESGDLGDKGIAKAQTAAFKTLLMRLFMITTGVDPEEGDSAADDGGANDCQGLLPDGEHCPHTLTPAQMQYSEKHFDRRLCPACQRRERERRS